VKPYRKFCYKALFTFTVTMGFIALAQYSLWATSPEGERAHMNRIHAQALADYDAHKRKHVMDIYNITEADLARPVDLFGDRGRI
jgi:hypothetical protein